ncbi:MAG: 50S ribosomal protein L15 [Candidatus Jacksonbacteria bacterium RIFCSPLOWO2_02_FULL_44_20]|uniref:Large ribosomal subunit protein uL15 n=1 Tax=Candidatus Jacksonbacteria bacterium RIFCSPLOWO2_02_FULL_44_20 TaxID=1798460 RepID=A0A1G2A9T4_9BACT|nr:MAG: 50S ribosomal protein L15 [Parcubacteria group bacterium GW2011_GWF2_44_17]OGY73673.1 MAG: 50S ribosomal protein L15 [Candidatus Jacksonbacteria bacterium RIFCSPLOWO2_02_FULL_44_20]
MPVKIHNLASVSKTKPKKRLGRGNSSGKGTYSTRGIKGQKARSGSGGMRKRSVMRQLIKKIPKLGGFRTPGPLPVSLSLEIIQKFYEDGETVNRASLVAKRIITARKARGIIKIIGNTKIKNRLLIEGIRLSKQAQSLIEKAGGSLLKQET